MTNLRGWPKERAELVCMLKSLAALLDKARKSDAPQGVIDILEEEYDKVHNAIVDAIGHPQKRTCECAGRTDCLEWRAEGYSWVFCPWCGARIVGDSDE